MSSSENILSISNTTILNSFKNLKTCGINTNRFDFEKLQTMINNIGFNNGLYYTNFFKNSYGLLCYNTTSLLTLENCEDITKLVSYTHHKQMGLTEDFVLDLSVSLILLQVSVTG